MPPTGSRISPAWSRSGGCPSLGAPSSLFLGSADAAMRREGALHLCPFCCCVFFLIWGGLVPKLLHMFAAVVVGQILGSDASKEASAQSE